MSSSLVREMTDSAAKVGRVMTTVYMIGGILVGLVLLAVSIWLFKKPIDHAGQAVAKVVSVKKCERVSSKSPDNQVTYTTHCNLELEYTVNGKVYKSAHSTSGSKYYTVGNTIPVRYNKDAPEDFVEGKVSAKRVAASVCLGVGLLVIGGSVFSWYMARKYKFVAAAQGMGTAYDIIT